MYISNLDSVHDRDNDVLYRSSENKDAIARSCVLQQDVHEEPQDKLKI